MAIAGAVIGAAGSLIGGIAQNNAAKQEAAQQRAIAGWNAERQREKASLAQARGAANAANKRRQDRKAASRHVAAVAQGGGSTTQGAPLLLRQEFAKESFYNSRVALFNAETEQADRENEANKIIYEGETRARAAQARGQAALLKGFSGAPY